MHLLEMRVARLEAEKASVGEHSDEKEESAESSGEEETGS
jgi:hypothetical protein